MFGVLEWNEARRCFVVPGYELGHLTITGEAQFASVGGGIARTLRMRLACAIYLADVTRD